MRPAKSASIGQTLRAGVALALGLAVALASPSAVRAQGATPVEKAAAPAVAFGPAALKGTWVRPDGGYRIEIKSIGANGQIEAMYFNPNPLPFAKASVRQDGKVLKVFLELRAGGYNGSTYELTYDAADDRLYGIYYQAVMKQKFDVVFMRR
jgi:hypothetical protein